MKQPKKFEVAPGIIIDQDKSPGIDILKNTFNVFLNRLDFFESLDTSGHRSFVSEETRVDGDQYYNLGIFHRRNEDVSSQETPPEEIARLISEAFSDAGYGVEANEYGMKVSIKKSETYKFIEAVYPEFDDKTKQNIRRLFLS